jgi:integral membrane protein
MEVLMERALRQYRIMAFVTGTALFLLYFVAVPLTWAHHPEFGRILGVGHGVVLCPLYLFTVGRLYFLITLRWWWWGFMVIAIFIPFLPIVMEHYVTKSIRSGALGTTRPEVGHAR